MRNILSIGQYLTNATNRLGIILTLSFFAVFPIHGFSAATSNNPYQISGPTQYEAAIEDEARMERVQNITNYLKAEAPHLMPGVPNYLLHPLRWALGEVRESESLLDFGFTGFVNDNDIGSVVHPVQNFMQPAAAEDPQATWLASTYHHHNGFLPTHDAMMMGMHSRYDLLDNYMRFDMHPYLGQGYFSTHGYWGTDFSLDLASPLDTSRMNKPWGRIVFGFSNGEDKLMDHGRGADLHGELRFNDHLTLNSGMRQSDTTGASNYVMLQWKLATE